MIAGKFPGLMGVRPGRGFCNQKQGGKENEGEIHTQRWRNGLR